MRMPKPQQGVMLIEALIGILIFSIGILALVGMQATAIKNTTDARYRSDASFLAQQIIGQMWVDMPSLTLYEHDDGTGHVPRNNWRTTVEQRLPGIDITNDILTPRVDVGPSAAEAPLIPALGANEVAVTIRWQQPGETTTRQFQMLNRINAGL